MTTDGIRTGQMSAIHLLVFNLMGIGLGPVIVASMTDFVFVDDAKVGMAILTSVVVCAVLSAGLLLFAAPSMRALVSQRSSERASLGAAA